MSGRPNYASPKYWDERYAATEGTMFDWYQTWESLEPHLRPLLRRERDFEIFVPGCGCSEVGPKLYDSGHENVTCVDISPVVVSWMRARYAAYSELEFAVMDVSAPGEDLEENMFDLVLDKALTDALACGDEHSRVHAAVSNFFTALRPGGKYVVISHAAPSRRLSLLGCARSIPGFDAVSALEPASDRDDDTLASGYSGTPAASAAAPPVLAWSAVEGKRLPKPSLDGRPTPTSHWMYILTK